jgi:two-component system, response regulator
VLCAGRGDTVGLSSNNKDAADGKEPLPPLLIAEDDADDLFFLRRLLAKAGVKNPIVSFADGGKAIEFLNDLAARPAATGGLPCIVFLDIRMPVAQGFEVLAFARKQPVFEHLKIVMLSSSDHPADKKRALELGANGYFVKHPSPEVLAAAVQGTLKEFTHADSAHPGFGR